MSLSPNARTVLDKAYSLGVPRPGDESSLALRRVAARHSTNSDAGAWSWCVMDESTGQPVVGCHETLRRAARALGAGLPASVSRCRLSGEWTLWIESQGGTK